MPAIPIISLIPRNECIFLLVKPSLTALPLTFKQRMDSRLPSNKAEPSSLFNSPEKVNGHDNCLDCFSEEPRNKKAYRYPWVLLACLTACLTACWLGSEKWKGTVVFYRDPREASWGVSGGGGTPLPLMRCPRDYKTDRTSG